MAYRELTAKELDEMCVGAINELETTLSYIEDLKDEMYVSNSIDYLNAVVRENQELDYELQHNVETIFESKGRDLQKSQIGELISLVRAEQAELLNISRQRIREIL